MEIQIKKEYTCKNDGIVLAHLIVKNNNFVAISNMLSPVNTLRP